MKLAFLERWRQIRGTTEFVRHAREVLSAEAQRRAQNLRQFAEDMEHEITGEHHAAPREHDARDDR